MPTLTHLQRLEAESIDILREAVAESSKPVLLYSIGKDSAVLLHLALKAFYPSRLPLPLLHVDTTWKFQEMIAFRDATARRLGLELIVHTNPDALRDGINPFVHGSAMHTDIWKTQGLKQALDQHGFDLAFGGARRDEEKSRAKERVFSLRSAQHRWDPKQQRPELWRLYNTRKQPGESLRVFPLSNWTELDIWQYIYREQIPIVPLYLARPRPVVARDGTLLMVDDARFPLRAGEQPTLKSVRFRTLGCYPLTGAVESHADTLEAIIEEMLVATTSERQGRMIDRDVAGSMGKEKTGRVLLMATASDADRASIAAYLAQQAQTGLLRFITCGSVDDGKSTLIGRLLYESKMLFEDQLETLAADSRSVGTQGDQLDFALLVDGLSAEREQGITIDVAYRFFATEHRRYIVADTPGHEQYTRNMVTGASTADLAVILIDARQGLLTQTRRHSYLVSLLGIRRIVVAVNKLDLMDYSQDVFERIVADYHAFAAQIGLTDILAIPISALRGDNITETSANTPWYRGPSLLQHLDQVPIGRDAADTPLRLPVQWVNRPNAEFRGYAGRLVGGSVRPGQRVRVLPSGKDSTVARIVTQDGDLDAAVAGQSVTLTLTDPIDISRGDVLCSIEQPAGVADQFEATIIWLSEDEMLAGRPCLLKLGARTVSATLAPPKYKVNVNTLEHLASKTLELNEIGVCTLTLDQPLAFDPYAENRDMGGFILIDRLSNATIAAGLLHFALRRSQNIHWQAIEIDKRAHAGLKGQRPVVLWFTGLSGAGKSTIANLVEKKLHALGRHSYLLDGDNVRHGLNKDLGFTDADRIENIRRVGEVAALMLDAGLIVLVSFISPFRAERQMARELLEPGEFHEVFVDTPIGEAERRDPKGLYKKARRGELKNFTGIDSPYEAPLTPEVRIDTTTLSSAAAAEQIVDYLVRNGVLAHA